MPEVNKILITDPCRQEFGFMVFEGNRCLFSSKVGMTKEEAKKRMEEWQPPLSGEEHIKEGGIEV